MKRNIIVALAVLALALCGCKKNVPDEAEDSEKANALLQVQTRAGDTGEDATVSYPVSVYVFQAEQCKALQTISDEEQTLGISLEEGMYTVYAIGGASETDYVIPSKEDATPSSVIALQDGKTLTDLMAAMSTVTLVEGETNTLTLSMERKVMLLQSVVISNLPTSATAVSVSIAPLWQNLTVGATYEGEQGTARIVLTKQDDGQTWKSTSEQYLFPPSTTTATISVSLTTAEGTKSYSYNSSGKLEAGYKINIEGTYTESVGVTLTGTITGEAWKGERTISFDFDEEGSSEGNGDNNGNNPSNFPAVGDIYEGCYVLAVNTLNATSAELTLLSPTEHVPIYDSNERMMNDLITSALATYGTHAVSGWHVPTAEEMAILATGYTGVEAAGQKPLGSTNKNYLFVRSSDNAYRSHIMGRTFTEEGNNPNAQTYLRPIATVTITSD